MKNGSLLAQKMTLFYEDVERRKKGEKMRQQTNKEVLQNEIKNIKAQYNVEMFSTNVTVRKTFVAKQKIRELKKRLYKTFVKALT